jgi:hypothetical protein
MLNKVVKIQYIKTFSEGTTSLKMTETTDRTIIPTAVPGNIKALDVTDLSEEKREQIADYYVEYADYISGVMKTAFSFEDWLSHTKGIDFTPKWRSFRPEQTKIIS